MRKAVPLLLALAGALICGQVAQAQLRQGGYDEATRQLEAGFKIVSSQRVLADDECYPAPDEIASELRQRLGIQVVVAPSLASLQGFGLVNVVTGETECNRLVLAIRAGLKERTFVLDSDYGPVYEQGGIGQSHEAQTGGAGPLRDLTGATGAVTMQRADQKARFEVHCPVGTSPLGGGWFNATSLGSDGEGLYPHSYERLGAQSGFHVTATYIDRSRPATPRRAAIQVICGAGLVPMASPHQTTFVSRHGTGTVTARCPEGTQLFSGGFQRTDFITPGVYGGDYITESRAVENGWRVSGGATDRYGGELTAIAYCADDPSLPVTEISSSASVGEGESASATTQRCPEGRALIAGGFSFGGSHDALFANGYFTRAGAWAATGYGWFGSAELTAYGYCAKAQDTVHRSAFPTEPPPPKDHGGAHSWLYVVLAALALLAIALFVRRRQVVRRRRARRG